MGPGAIARHSGTLEAGPNPENIWFRKIMGRAKKITKNMAGPVQKIRANQNFATLLRS